jgi:hypothetical protein
MVDEEDNITTADGLSALTTDLGTAAARLEELLGGRPPEQSLASLPRVERDEVRAIQKMFKEWLDGFREARRS